MGGAEIGRGRSRWRGRRCGAGSARDGGLVGIGEADEEGGEFEVGGLRVNDFQAALDGGALGGLRVVDAIAFDEGVGPAGLLDGDLLLCVEEEGFGVGAGGDVDKDGADNLGPGLVGGEVEDRAAVVRAAPVVEQGGIAAIAIVEMAGQFEVERSGGEELERGIDDIEANLLGGGGPAEGGGLELVGGVIVLMLGRGLLDAGGQAARFLHVEVVACVPVGSGRHDAVALRRRWRASRRPGQ